VVLAGVAAVAYLIGGPPYRLGGGDAVPSATIAAGVGGTSYLVGGGGTTASSPLFSTFTGSGIEGCSAGGLVDACTAY